LIADAVSGMIAAPAVGGAIAGERRSGSSSPHLSPTPSFRSNVMVSGLVTQSGNRRVRRAFNVLLAAVVGTLATAAEVRLRADEPTAVANERIRTFRSIDGKTLRGKAVAVTPGSVIVESTGDKRTEVPLNQLSPLDQKYVKGLQATAFGSADAPARAATAGSRSSGGRTAGTQLAAAVGGGGDWSQWRGPRRDGVCDETGLNDDWPSDGPPLLWRVRGLGDGFSSVSISQGKLYTMGRSGGDTWLVCRDLQDGGEVWKTKVGGGDRPNCTPTVDPEANLVFGVSHGGDLLCAEADTGREVWRKNFGRDFQGQMMSGWGFSESPLVDGDRLICTPGGERALLAALDKRTGAVVWTTPAPNGSLGNAGKDGAGYASVVVSNAQGVKQYVTLVGRGIVSVDAETGKGLWSYNRIANGTANIPTPIVVGNYVFCSSGYGDGGTALLEVQKQGRSLSVREVWYLRANELQNHHGGMVLLGDYVYLGNGHNNGFPACVDLKTGRNVWGRQRGAGSDSAAIVYADGDIYFRYQDATLALVEANPKEYRLKKSFKIASHNGESWPHPVIQDKRLYLRDQDELLCYDLR